jgi:hypothetical protein
MMQGPIAALVEATANRPRFADLARDNTRKTRTFLCKVSPAAAAPRGGTEQPLFRTGPHALRACTFVR